MVEYEFRNIEESIRGAVESLESKRKNVAKPGAKDRDAVRQESDRAQSAFVLRTLDFETERQVRQFVQFHEFKLVLSIDAFHYRIPNEARILLTPLEDLVEFLRTGFPGYFSIDFAAPVTYRERALILARTY